MDINYSVFTEEQKDLIFEYCDNGMKKLKHICHSIWAKKGLPNCYHDDLYDDAMEVLSESILTFNPDCGASFKTYLTNNIHKSYSQWYRDTHLRAKRNNLELDENGKIKKDEKNNPIIVPNVSFDAPINEDGLTIKDTISDKRTVESEFFGENEETFSLEMMKYLSRLSPLQRKVLHLISIGYKPSEIVEELHINKKLYDDCYNAIHSYRNISVLI